MPFGYDEDEDDEDNDDNAKYCPICEDIELEHGSSDPDKCAGAKLALDRTEQHSVYSASHCESRVCCYCMGEELLGVAGGPKTSSDVPIWIARFACVGCKARYRKDREREALIQKRKAEAKRNESEKQAASKAKAEREQREKPLKEWLQKISGLQELDEVLSSFMKHKISISDLPELSEQHLKEMGITAVGTIIKVMKAVRQIEGSSKKGSAGVKSKVQAKAIPPKPAIVKPSSKVSIPKLQKNPKTPAKVSKPSKAKERK